MARLRTRVNLLPMAIAALALVVVARSVSSAAPVTGDGLTYGTEYLARTEHVEIDNQWFAREVYCRAVYSLGALIGAEVARTVDHYRGPVLAYGPAQVASSEIRYDMSPHACLVTTYERTIYRCGRATGTQGLPELTRTEDVCAVSEGQPYAVSAAVVATPQGEMLRVEYSIPVYHSNARYGTFLVGQRSTTEIIPAKTDSANRPAVGRGPWPSPATSTTSAALPLDEAMLSMSSVSEFHDYLAVQESAYRRDIEEAFDLGLIVGKYDQQGRFYDPGGLITLGEMVNILARNYGAAPSVAGTAAVAHLGAYGVAVPGDLGSALTLSQLEALATQLHRLDQAPRADLVVVRQALARGFDATDSHAGGITREFAVAMFRPVAVLSQSGPLPVATLMDAASAPGDQHGRDADAVFVLSD